MRGIWKCLNCDSAEVYLVDLQFLGRWKILAKCSRCQMLLGISKRGVGLSGLKRNEALDALPKLWFR